MRIYVKDYLRKIPLLKRMCDIIVAYAAEYPPENLDSFSGFRDAQSLDDVATFIDYVSPTIGEYRLRFPKLSDGGLAEMRKNNVNYLTALFYSVKGTYKVLDYLTEYDLFHQTPITSRVQEQDTTSVISYSARSIVVNINEIPGFFDRDLFCTYLEKFLSSLLYFESLTINIDSVSVEISDTTTVSLNSGDAYYQYYEIKADDI